MLWRYRPDRNPLGAQSDEHSERATGTTARSAARDSEKHTARRQRDEQQRLPAVDCVDAPPRQRGQRLRRSAAGSVLSRLVRPRTLRAQLITLVIAALLPLVIFASAMVVAFGREQRVKLEHALIDTAHALSLAVDRELEASIRSLQLLGTSASLQSGNLKRFYEEAATAISTQPYWDAITLVDESGQQLLTLRLAFGAPQPPGSPQNPARLRVIETGRPEVSDLYIGRITQHWLVAITVPVLRSGKATYALTASVVPDSLLQLVSQEMLPADGMATIIDGNALVIARTKDFEQFVGKPALPAFAAASKKGVEGVWQDVDEEGTAVYGGFRRSELSRWSLGLAIPVTVAEAPYRRSLAAITIASALLLLSGLALASFIGRRITKSVAALSASAEAIGHGEIPPISASPTVEVNEVARALSRAAVERNRAEEGLQDAEARLRLALQAGRIGTWDWNMATGKIIWSSDTEILWGIAPGTFKETFEEFDARLHPEDRDRVKHAVAQAIAERRTFRHEFRIIWPDGSTHWIASRGELSFDGAGRPLRMIGVAMDVTERKHAEDALRESHERLQRALEASQTGTWRVDLRSGFDTRDASLNQMLGLPAEPSTLPVDDWFTYVHPDDASSMRLAWEKGLASGVYEEEHRLVRRDGRVLWVHDRGVMVRGADGQPLYAIGAAMDITDRKRAEEDIRQLNESLERRVAERTAELERANEELEAFSYSVSHDLRAPLRRIDGFAHLLAEHSQELNETAMRCLQGIFKSAARMGQLIDGLLELSRTGRVRLHKQRVDLNRLVREVREDCARDAKDRNIVWSVAKLPIVEGDAGLLRAAFVNLLSNAVKFSMQRDPAIIEISATRGDDGKVVIHIKDNGAGFDARYADKLFGVFQRLHREDEFEGTGIGLATVRRIVDRHGGRIWADGEPDRGATFHLSLTQWP